MNNAQWSVRGRGGGGGVGGCSTSCPSLCRNPEVEQCHIKPAKQTGSAFLPSVGQKELGTVAKTSSPWREKASASQTAQNAFE